MCAFKEMRRIKCCCNFLITNPEEMYLFRNTRPFQDLDIDVTHVTQGGSNYQSCIVTAIKNFHQEINKYLTISASMIK